MSLSRIGFGVAFGANNANHPDAWHSGSPASLVVGTVGTAALRAADAIAYAVMVPGWDWG